MKVKEAINMFTYHQGASLKARTLQSYRYILEKFEQFGEQEFDSIGPDEIYQFLENLTKNCSKSAGRLRY